MSQFDDQLKPKVKQEIVTEVQQEYKLLGSIRLIPGLKLYKLNTLTLEYREVTVQKKVVIGLDGNVHTKKRVNAEQNCIYFQALNIKNAKKHAMRELEKLIKHNLELKFKKNV